MQMDVQQVFDAALQLPEADRFALVSRLLQSTPDELPGLSMDDDNLIEELDRRFNDLEGAVDWNDLRKLRG
jgi:hypothetical protein